MNKDDKKKRRLILYWYYTIMELFPPEEFDRKDIEEGIDFIKTYHSNKCKKKIMPKEELNKNLYFKAKLVKLRLEVPQEYYSVDYQKHLEESSFYLPLPSRPSVDQLFSRYKSEYYKDVPYDQEITESLIRDRKEIDKLVQRMIPDDPLGKFFEFIKELKDEGKMSKITDKSKSNAKLESLREKDALKLLNKLEDNDFEPNIDEKEIMNHPTFKAYRSSYMDKFRDEGFDLAINILETEGSLPLELFYELCRSPSPFYNKFLEGSFIWYCTFDGTKRRGRYVNRCKNKEFKKVDTIGDDKKIVKAFKLIKKA